MEIGDERRSLRRADGVVVEVDGREREGVCGVEVLQENWEDGRELNMLSFLSVFLGVFCGLVESAGRSRF